jgi:hypothetical protein
MVHYGLNMFVRAVETFFGRLPLWFLFHNSVIESLLFMALCQLVAGAILWHIYVPWAVWTNINPPPGLEAGTEGVGKDDILIFCSLLEDYVNSVPAYRAMSYTWQVDKLMCETAWKIAFAWSLLAMEYKLAMVFSQEMNGDRNEHDFSIIYSWIY